MGLACESASVRQVARQFGLVASTVRAIDLRYLQRWNATRRKDRLEQMGVDEIYFGKQMKFITVVSNLETGEPLWFGQDRKQETLDEFFRTQLKESQRKRIAAACVDMWRPFTNSIEQWAPNCRIIYDKFHILQHANKAIDEVRRAEFFRKGGRMRGVVKGKRWLLLTRWMNLDSQKRQQLNELFALNRRVMKAYLLKESLERLWTYHYEGAMLRYLQKSWISSAGNAWNPLRPGLPERQTHDYKRYGTTTLFAAFNILNGKVIGSCLPRHRGKDLRSFSSCWRSKSLRSRRAHHFGQLLYPKSTKVQQWRNSRKRRRFHFHFTPTSSSWLNQVERFFALITERMIRRGTFRSVEDWKPSTRN